MENDSVLTCDFKKNIEIFDKAVRYGESFDLIKRELNINGTFCVMYYIDGFVKAEMMQKLMMYLMSQKDFGNSSKGDAEKFQKKLPAVEVNTENRINNIITAVMSGCTAFFCEGFGPDCLILDARTYPAREAAEPENDKVMRGSRDGFVETLIFNTAMIRRRIRDPRFTVKYVGLGSETRTDTAICYLDGVADEKYVNDLTNKLEELDTDAIVLGHRSVAETLARKGWYNPFPKIRTTERPDAAAASILEGAVALVCDNSPEVMLFPVSLFSFMQETDDFYFPPFTGSYLRLVRHAVFWFTVFVTPVWYLLLMHQASIPEWLLFIVPESPGQIPIIAQLFLTEFVLDGLKLASLNTPNVLASSLSVVGGLLLGDFAVQTGWLCADTILYMAFVSIANFTQSSYELGYAFKFVRMLTLLFTALWGIWGFAISIVAALLFVSFNKTADGKRRYLYPLIPFNGRALMRLMFRLKKRR